MDYEEAATPLMIREVSWFVNNQVAVLFPENPQFWCTKSLREQPGRSTVFLCKDRRKPLLLPDPRVVGVRRT